MKSARYAFAAHPEALADLRNIPDHIRDLALLELQHLVHGNERGAPLTRELAGCHKVYVDPETRWRLVIQFRDAPATSQHRREIYLLAVGERQDHTAYRLASQRLEHDRSAVPTHQSRAEAARSRSAHSTTAKQPPTTPATPPRTTTASARRVL
ncbi:type II toxin-antitoxin system RelE family toxin [Streptomyces sp. BH097]|uniref:type II toxin-antitoxin system RelE family toxin n=1 Tax=unclassified Streptomyces TaxID=2593676 RepID=UPI003BB7AFDE